MHVLLTGATGLVGQYLMRDLLLAGTPLAVLIRRQGSTSAARRLEQILLRWERESGSSLPRPICLEGDISRPGLGLTGQDRRWVGKHCDSLLHSAASLTFSGKDRTQEPWLSNLTGVHNVLDFCKRTGPRRLHAISTAYVCGRRHGPVLEDDLELAQDFRNDYEQSKFEAEAAIRASDFLEQRTVYRPAIIVGDSRTGYTSTYHGLYNYLQFVWLLVSYLEPQPDGRYRIDFRLNLTGDEPRNLVPVDWVSVVITHILRTPRLHGACYHLTPPTPITARQIEEAMSAYFNYYGPVFIGRSLDRSEMTEIEKSFHDHVGQYEPYWAEEPVFDCRNTLAAAPHLPCPAIADCLHTLIDFAVRDRWGKRSRRQSTAQTSEALARAACSGSP
jgi:thioester reductase-like protein